jgi:3-phosphoshikimate 1-carboxyvinyltransferase
VKVEPAAALAGHIAVPGDKSVSHRALLVGAVADGETRVEGFGRSADTEATLRAVRALGAEVAREPGDALLVRGRGLRGLVAPQEAIDCGNAGTLMRLLPGILVGQEGRFELVGDQSLAARPMERVAEPLRRMGARIETTDGRAPLVVEGGHPLAALDYKLPVASAQVKSAALLAGLYAERGRTTVVEPVPTRDHTELLLQAAGARVTRRPHSVSVFPAQRLSLRSVTVPGDFSAAAPFLVAAVLLAGSSVTVHGVGLNPRRTGLLDVLARMGARIAIYNRRRLGVEPVGDVEIHATPLVATTVAPEEVPRLVDELPLVALAAGRARGETVVRGAGELRVKESDRIEGVVGGLRGLGVRIAEREDGFAVRGVPARPRGGTLATGGDHRLAILGAVAGLVSREGVTIEGSEAVAISFPGFFELLDQLAQRG